MGHQLFLSTIIPLLVLVSDCDAQQPYRGEKITASISIRIAPGPNCWFPNFYCSVTEANRLESPLVITGGPEACMDTCTGSCKFFTWFTRRGIEYCYKLHECGPDYRVYDDWCLTRGPSCSSGPSSCDLIPTDNADCPQLIGYPNKMEWQCEDGGPGLMVNGYNQSLKAGTRCLLSCDSWTSQRWSRKSALIYTNRDKGFLFSECKADGSWATVNPNDITDGTQHLQWPSHPYPYPNPQETPPSCGCKPLTLVWPPSEVIDPALTTLAFYYNPRDEEGATFECETEVQNYDVWRTKQFEVTSNNTCRFLCDDFLVALVTCVDGKWTGMTEKGFWCYTFPKFENRLKNFTSNSTAACDDCCILNGTMIENQHYARCSDLLLKCSDGELLEQQEGNLAHCLVDNLVYLIDDSGSMMGSKHIWHPVASGLEQKLYDYNVNLASYTLMDYVTIVTTDLVTTNRTLFKNAIDITSYHGSKELTFEGLKTALGLVPQFSFIVLFSDEVGDDTTDQTLKNEIISLRDSTASTIYFMMVPYNGLEWTEMVTNFQEIGSVYDIKSNPNATQEVLQSIRFASHCTGITNTLFQPENGFNTLEDLCPSDRVRVVKKGQRNGEICNVPEQGCKESEKICQKCKSVCQKTKESCGDAKSLRNEAEEKCQMPSMPDCLSATKKYTKAEKMCEKYENDCNESKEECKITTC